MKLDRNNLKQLIREALSDKQSALLETPELDTVLQETTFNRVKHHIDDTDTKFLVLSAERHVGSKLPDGTEVTAQVNNKRTNELAQLINGSGYSHAKVSGSWVEKNEAGEEVRVTERSYIVYENPNPSKAPPTENLYNLGKKWSKMYNQDAFIYGWVDETGQRQIQARHADGSIAKYGGPWTTLEPIEKDAEFWSKVRGSTFVFAEYAIHEDVVEIEAPNSVIEAMRKAHQHKGKKIKFVRRKR